MAAADSPGNDLYARLQAAIDLREQKEGISPADLLELDDDLAALVVEVARHDQATVEEVAASVDMDAGEVARLLAILSQKGYVTVAEVEGAPRFRARFGARRGRYVPGGIWDALGSLDDG